MPAGIDFVLVFNCSVNTIKDMFTLPHFSWTGLVLLAVDRYAQVTYSRITSPIPLRITHGCPRKCQFPKSDTDLIRMHNVV